MRNFDLSPLYRSAIGFDRLFNLLENNQSQSNGGYPPYNVELVDENNYRIAIAVAGFAESELEITAQDNLLIVKAPMPPSRKSALTCIRASLNAILSVNSSLRKIFIFAAPAR